MKEKDSMEWKVLSSQYISQEPWFTVRKEKVQLPNGNTIDSYYVLEYPNWVNVTAITKDGKFIFERQYRHGLRSTSYELCAGVCEKEDSSPLISAQRELREETGYGKGEWEEFMIISPNPGTHTNLTYCYLATNVEKISEPHLEATEDIQVKLLTIEEVKDLLENNKITQAQHAAPLWKYIALYRGKQTFLNFYGSIRTAIKARAHRVSYIFLLKTCWH